MKSGLGYPKSFNVKTIELNLQKWVADVKLIIGAEVGEFWRDFDGYGVEFRSSGAVRKVKEYI